jgi:hypothetical protein
MKSTSIKTAKELADWLKDIEYRPEDPSVARVFRPATDNPNAYDISEFPGKIVAEAISSLTAKQQAKFQFVRKDQYAYAIIPDKIVVTVPERCKLVHVKEGHHIPHDDIVKGVYESTLEKWREYDVSHAHAKEMGGDSSFDEGKEYK